MPKTRGDIVAQHFTLPQQKCLALQAVVRQQLQERSLQGGCKDANLVPCSVLELVQDPQKGTKIYIYMYVYIDIDIDIYYRYRYRYQYIIIQIQIHRSVFLKHADAVGVTFYWLRTGFEQNPAIGESLSPINQAVGELPRDEYTLWQFYSLLSKMAY